MVKAKFTVQQKTAYGYSPDACEVKLVPVMAAEGEDSLFGKATPNGEIRMYITNPKAHEALELGLAYYVTFEKA